MATDGETMVYTTACYDEDFASDGSFAPLQVHYSERFSAAGRTAGGYLKRDGRPREGEVLVARLVDRPLRPALAKGWAHSTQVLSWVLSYDGEHSPEPLAITAAGAALAVSDVPMRRVVAGVRVGLLPDLGLVVNPTVAQMEESTLDLIIAGTSEAVLMIEGYCSFLTEEQMLEAVRVGQEAVAGMCVAIERWAAGVGRLKRTDCLVAPPEGLDERIQALIGSELEGVYRTVRGKQERSDAVGALRALARAAVAEEPAAEADAGEAEAPYADAIVSAALKRVESRVMRALVLREGYRADGRALHEVRPITCRAGALPRTHGSALFTRGETQAIAVTTLGCKASEQRVDEMAGEEGQSRRFYLQYFFPPSSVGETGRVGAPGRREIGHGNLAERALAPVVPPEESFPYTVRVESTITESNGSSSMASVCGGWLSMADAGVPLSQPVAGIAMGLVLEPDGQFAVLTDILGSEDSLGDMDFKVAGSADAITAFQLDIKVEGITLPILRTALEAAREGRRAVLGAMARCAPPPAGELSRHAPRILSLTVPADKIGALIGPGGRNIRSLQEATGAEIMVDGDCGRVTIKAYSAEALELAQSHIMAQVLDPEPGMVYRQVRVTSVLPFGAIVEVLPRRDGMVHISEWDVSRVAAMTDVVSEGDMIDVQVLESDGGKIKLSRKAVLILDGVVPPPSPPSSSGTDSEGGMQPGTPGGRPPRRQGYQGGQGGRASGPQAPRRPQPGGY